jgi:1-deoxy-D-xylulose-5-phosphate reductoisomerase
MGRKISIDSATLLNKGLEVIEAYHLFAVPQERIDVVIHRQSIVHAMIRCRDGTVFAQLAVPDMRIAVFAALCFPEQPDSAIAPLDPFRLGRLDFDRPDEERFPALGLARAALQSGGEMPAVLNAANEVAVQAFLDRRCPFARITATIARVMERWTEPSRPIASVDQALAVDAEARRMAVEVLGNTSPSLEVPSS